VGLAAHMGLPLSTPNSSINKHSLADSDYEGHRRFAGSCRDIIIDQMHFLLDDIRFLLETGNVSLRVSTALIVAIVAVNSAYLTSVNLNFVNLNLLSLKKYFGWRGFVPAN